MKHFKLCLALLLIIGNIKAQDLPNPTSNTQTLPVGSLVIAMDNVNQANPGYFNLKAYGLITTLLNANKHLLWVIKVGKVHDGIDFTVAAERLYPTFASASSKDFKAGPFVISAADTNGVGVLINTFNAAQTAVNRVNVYRTTSPITIDIRYDMNGYVPKAGILNDGGNAKIHVKYMTNASVPTSNYTTLTTAANLGLSCYTFASEPHNGSPSTALIDSIRKFITITGGNFLAECAAIEGYENVTSGRFQSTGGYNNINTSLTNNVSYDNADLAYAQFQGTFNPNNGGSTQTYVRLSGSNPTNNFYSVISGNTLALSTTYGASVSKLIPGAGGLVFYLGNHNLDGTTEQLINGQRMYLNAFLIPASAGCPYTVVPVKIEYFNARKVNNDAELNWKVSIQDNIEYYVVQRSVNNSNYIDISTLTPNQQGYYTLIDDKTKIGYNLYRIKSVEYSGQVSYSTIASVNFIQTKPIEITYNNNILNISCKGVINRKTILIYSVVGNKVYGEIHSESDININLEHLNKGVYIVYIIDDNGMVIQNKFVK
jgi:hypothetical protein